MSWTLCSKADVISIHPTAEAVLPDLQSSAVEQIIREHLGLPGLGLTQTEVTELYSGNGTAFLTLQQLPIISVKSLSMESHGSGVFTGMP